MLFIDPNLLKPERATIYLYRRVDERSRNKFDPGNFVPYRPDLVPTLATLPDDTKTYYNETIARDGRPPLYHRVPHVLYRGALNAADLPIFIA